eukprot:6202613-Pleurochrysis_carterae.AAC.3
MHLERASRRGQGDANAPLQGGQAAADAQRSSLSPALLLAFARLDTFARLTQSKRGAAIHHQKRELGAAARWWQQRRYPRLAGNCIGRQRRRAEAHLELGKA